MPAARCSAMLVAGLLLSAAAHPLAAQQEDDRWMRDCQNDHSDQARYCEVRHLGFRPAGGRLTISPDQNGGVEVEGWDRDSVAVAVRIQAGARTEEAARDLARRIQVEAGGSSIRVSGPSSGRRESWGASLVLRVPRRMDLTAETVNGPLAVEGVTGTMDLRTRNGPVSLTRVAGDVRARLENGPLDVELAGARWEGKGLDAESVNGPVDLSIPEGYNAELETGTINGPMESSFPLTVTFQGRMRDRFRTTLGKGGAPVRVVTTNGPFTIRHARD